MQFKTYFFALTPPEREAFAKKTGTSVGHLNNCAYGYTTFSPVLCVSIEQVSDKEVTRQELRPDDWPSIWPELSAKTFTRANGEVVTNQRKA